MTCYGVTRHPLPLEAVEVWRDEINSEQVGCDLDNGESRTETMQQHRLDQNDGGMNLRCCNWTVLASKLGGMPTSSVGWKNKRQIKKQGRR